MARWQTPEYDAMAHAIRIRSIVEMGRQSTTIGHRDDESGPGANSPVIGMRKPETLLGFADDCGRRFIDPFGLKRPLGRLWRGHRH